MNRKEGIIKAFSLIEKEYDIFYTKKYHKEYVMEAFIQEEKTLDDFFGLNRSRAQLVRIFKELMPNKPKSAKWYYYILSIAGLKQCPSCKEVKEHENFSKAKQNWDNTFSICRNCDSIKGKEYKKQNPDKIKESARKSYNKKKRDDPAYFKRKNALARRRLKQRTPKWITEEEKVAIQDFYANCPEGYHVDHIIPLNGAKVNGLHVLANLQYLIAKENSSKHNNFNIIEFNNL